MVNKKIKAIARIERDAQNFFFVKMLYAFKNEGEPQTVYGIDDSDLKDNLIAMSCMALETFQVHNNIGYSVIIYNPKTQYCYHDYRADYKMSNKILVGTIPMNNFDEINYLIHMISETIEKNDMGEFYVQYKDKIMTEIEFYQFQKSLSIYKI